VTHRDQIPHLLRLIDDESPEVRARVMRELASFGPELEEHADEFGADLTPKQRWLFQSLLAVQREADRFTASWDAWLDLPSEPRKLESAMALLAQFQYGWRPPVRLGEQLDELAHGFLTSGRSIDPVALARFLFVTKELRGAVSDYYSPMNSNLIHVIERRRGLPISLACIFILVGDRVGIEVHGVNAPGHFLTRAEVSGKLTYFDPFNGGRVLAAREVNDLRSALPRGHEALIDEPASAMSIVVRVLNNLISAYERAGDDEKAHDAGQLLRRLQARSFAADRG
jgi:regulator of sirC expression with transglutaminase-like and TPR domain